MLTAHEIGGAPGTYLVKVEGDSMEGAGIFYGDLLIVDEGISAKAGQVIIGVVNQQPLIKYLGLLDVKRCFV